MSINPTISVVREAFMEKCVRDGLDASDALIAFDAWDDRRNQWAMRDGARAAWFALHDELKAIGGGSADFSVARRALKAVSKVTARFGGDA